jgi:DNA-binding MarR family transcriptional regulator
MDYGHGSVRRYRRDYGGRPPRRPSFRTPAHADLWTRGFDDEIHQPVRFLIMSLLHRSNPNGMRFTAIRDTLRLTEGNLGSHLDRLDRVGYIHRWLETEARLRFTAIKLTAAGRTAYAAHVAALQDLIAGYEEHGG